MLVVFNNTICPGNLIWVRSRNESKPGIGHSQVRPVSGFSEPASPAAGHESPGLQVVLGPCSAGPRAARGNPPAPQPGASLVRRVPSGSTRSNRSAGRETKPTNSRGRVSKSMSAPPPGAIVHRSVTRGGGSAAVVGGIADRAISTGISNEAMKNPGQLATDFGKGVLGMARLVKPMSTPA